MTSGTIDPVKTNEALREAAVRAAGLLGQVRRADAAVPGLTWTAAETAAHLVGEIKDYAGYAGGTLDPGPPLLPGDAQTPAERNAEANAGQLARHAERDPARLAGQVVPAVDEFIAAAGRCAPGQPVRVSNGKSMTPAVMTAALLGEILIHGLDIARAAGLTWQISRADALSTIPGVMALVPDYIDHRRAAGLHVSYELRFRGGPRYRIAIDDGTAAISGPGARADCWISADPVAFMLVGYGRTGQLGQIARGKLLAGGRKPWLGFSFGQLITGP